MSNLISYEGEDYHPNAVFVFDFDGVLASIDEHDVFTYSLTDIFPATDDPVNKVKLDKLLKQESELIEKACDRWNINAAGVDKNYIRHLVFQHASWLNNSKIIPGSYLDLAKQVSRTSRLFVFSARSGWSAVERARKFLQYHDIHVHEFFSVGRGKKIQQFEKIVTEAKDVNSISVPVYFFDDDENHTKSIADEAKKKNWELKTKHVIPRRTSQEKLYIASKAQKLFFKEVKAALKPCKHGNVNALSTADFYKPLSHARALFVYHAGQRLTSLRYFQLAYGAIAAGYFTLLSGPETDSFHQSLGLMLIAAVGVFLCKFFMQLDKRNGDLVQCADNAIQELEYRISTQENLFDFETLKSMDNATVSQHQFGPNIKRFICTLFYISLLGICGGVVLLISLGY